MRRELFLTFFTIKKKPLFFFSKQFFDISRNQYKVASNIVCLRMKSPFELFALFEESDEFFRFFF